MNKYFIIDPKAISSFQKFRSVYPLLQPEKFRFVYDVPENWINLVLKRRFGKAVNDKKFHEYLMMRKNVLLQTASTLSTQEEIYNYPLALKKLEQLDGIVVDNRKKEIRPRVVKVSNLFLEDDVFRENSSLGFLRNLAEIEKIIKPFLMRANILHIVDRYFYHRDRSENINIYPDYVNMLKKIIDLTKGRINKPPLVYIYYVIPELRPGNDEMQFRSILNRNGINILLDKTKIAFIMIPYEDMHNRYLITDIGAIKFGKSTAPNLRWDEYDDVSGVSMEDLHTLITPNNQIKYIDLDYNSPNVLIYP